MASLMDRQRSTSTQVFRTSDPLRAVAEASIVTGFTIAMGMTSPIGSIEVPSNPEKFFQDYVAKRKPVVIRGLPCECGHLHVPNSALRPSP